MPMSWPYRFKSVSPAEVQHRRDVLNLRGYYAQSSALVVIFGIFVYRNYFRKDSTRRAKKISWWDSPPFQGWTETRRQYFITLLWLGWLLSLSVWNTGDDYLHFTKALGHVSLSQLPFQFLLSPTSFIFTSNPALPSILSVMTSIPQPALTPYHRLFGRLVVLPLLLGHGALYLLFFAQSSHPDFGTLLMKRVQDPDVQWGLAGLGLALSVLLFQRRTPRTLGSLLGYRKRTFYVVHLSLVAGMLAAAWFHVIYARVFVLEAVGIFLANIACCWALAESKRTPRT
ncbi:hypothetical protein VTN02DRAFT_162 [Thermoascus thermophilus]